MGGSTEAQQKTTTTNELSPEQQQIMKLAMPGIESFAATVPQRYQGSTVAGFDPAQTEAQNMALDAAGTQNDIASKAASGLNFYTSGNIWDPANNPYLQQAVDAAVRPVTENYQQVVQPAVRDTYQAAGQQFGGSRQNLSEGTAANSYMRNVGDTASKLVQGEYDTNVNAQLKALGLVPTIQGAQTAGAQTTSAVGDVRQALTQAQLDEKVKNFNYDQLAPYLQSQELVNMVSGMPGGGTTSTSVGNNPRTGAVSSAIGGAAAGASLGSLLGPVGTGGGAALGGLLAFLGK